MQPIGNMSTTLPTDLKHSECEKGDPGKYGKAPPIRFAIESQSSRDDRPTVNIYTSDDTKETYYKFKDGSPEELVEHVRNYWEIIRKLDLESTYDVEKQAIAAAKRQKNEGNTHGRALKDLNQVIEDSTLNMKKSIAKAFKTFSDLLDADLVPKWNEIVKKECRTKGYIALDGVKVKDKKRGENFEGLRACVRTWMKQNGIPKNSADRLRHYLLCQVRKGSRVPVGPFIDRMVVLNGYLKDLPCLKDEEGSPTQLPRMDEPYGSYAMCSNILMALPEGLSVAYSARKGDSFAATEVEKLKNDLELIEPEYRQTQKIIEMARNSGGGSKDKAKDKGTKRSLDDPIPRKPKAQAARQKKLCQHCAKWSPDIKNTHNTAQCRKWNSDGTKWQKPKHARKTNAHSQVSEDMMECFAQMRKDNAKLLKSLKRSRKKGKRSRRRYSDSESDSDSDE